MAALALTTRQDHDDWLSVAEAAKRLDLTGRRVRQLCAGKWQHLLLAKVEDGEWRIHVNADVSLAERGPDACDADAEFKLLPQPLRTEAIQRAQCVAAFRDARSRPGAMKDVLPRVIDTLNQRYPGLRISRTSLYRWHDAAGEPIDLLELVDPRKLPKADNSPNAPAISQEAINYFIEAYLYGNASVQVAHERTADFARSNGYTWCGSAHQARRLKRRLIDKQTEMQHRDPKRYRSMCRPWIERDPESFAANECWVSDHRPLDIICYVDDPEAKDGRRYFRPYVTVWIDWRTRVVLGWALVETPNTASILAAMKMALLNNDCAGPPRFAWIDNGRDFDSYTMQGITKAVRRQMARTGEMQIDGEQTLFPGVFGLLHIEPHHAIPYEGQGKARCERVFSTMGCRFDVTFASYTGKDTTRKPEDLSLNIAAGRAPHFDDVKSRLADWIVGYNINTEHSLDDLRGEDAKGFAGVTRLSRLDAYRAWSSPAVMPDRQTIEMVCWRWPAPPSRKDKRQLGRRVGRNGVSVSIGGATVRFGQYDPALRPFKGTDRQVVVCYDPDDVDQLYVFDDHMALVTVAQRNAVVGRYTDPMTEGQLKEASRNKAAYEKAGKFRRKHREHEYLTTEEIAAQNAAAARKPVERDPDQPMRLVQTRIDDAVKDVQKHAIRQAAGGETSGGGGGRDPMIDVTTLLSARPRAEAVRADDRMADPLDLIADRGGYEEPADESIDPMSLFIGRGAGGAS